MLLVVGNGMVSHRFCERMADWDSAKRHHIVVVGEEPYPAYDRVQLTSFLSEKTASKLTLGGREWYEKKGIDLHVGTKIVHVDPVGRKARTDTGNVFAYGALVLATGSEAATLAVPGVGKKGVFVYRTIDDLKAIAAYAVGARSAVVVGGGLLGLEAARAVLDLGLETHLVEIAPRLMPRQLDEKAASLLERAIRALGVHVHTDERVAAITGDDAASGVVFSDGRTVLADLIILSLGIRPRDELARASGIAVASRGGVIVDDRLATSHPSIFAIGEVAHHRGVTYGLVRPGHAMADVVARNFTGGDAIFEGSDMSAKLKLLGTDVATFGDPFQLSDHSRVVSLADDVRGVYQKLVFAADSRRLLGGILVGDSASYGPLLQLTRTKTVLSEGLEELGLGPAARRALAPDDALVCACNSVSAEAICTSVRLGGLTSVAQIKACTQAGTGCGGCLPVVSDLLAAELKACGRATKPFLCEHFKYTRQELFQIVSSRKIRTFAELRRDYGTGEGCEICKPTVASILASTRNEPILNEAHRSLQDSNDRYLANIQKDGTYSVVPRVPGGEITAQKLIALGQVAEKFGLYSKITGGQRIDLLGARVEQLPDIWEQLIAAGFESGHAYGKAVRTVKSCVGSIWCRFGVQDSTAFAIRIENRYKGLRAPHKLKSAVSGCVRECAEAQSKDFGLIATEKGWNVFVCGNGGASPRHADLLATDVTDDLAIRYIDRFLMFYIRTADRLTRTSVWLDKMEGGIEHLKQVVVHDLLGVAADLERDMQALVDSYSCEWADVVSDPVKRAQFQHFSAQAEPTVPRVPEPQVESRQGERMTSGTYEKARRLPVLQRAWVRVASANDVPRDGGIAIRYGSAQIAIFRVESRGELFATQNMCPHNEQMVLARGIVGDAAGTPKIACPMHKKTFDLRSGACLSGDSLNIATFPVRVEGNDIWVELPPADDVAIPVCESLSPSATDGKGDAKRMTG